MARPVCTPAQYWDGFWKNVTETNDQGCWIWTSTLDTAGYGYYYHRLNGVRGRTGAHRLSYMFMVGDIPEGLSLDHLCRNPPCVNPDHLDPVPHYVNMARMAEARPACRRGHEYTPENTSYRVRPGAIARICRTCKREKSRRARAKSKSIS